MSAETKPAATRLYVAGPMTGLTDFNYPAFNRAAALLRGLGYEVENPAENDACGSWAVYLRASLAQVVRCDGLALLPGWEASRGARLEVHVADALGMEIASVDSWADRLALA